MHLYIYVPDVRARAISNYEGTVKAMTLNGRMSTPRFEHELEAALVKATRVPRDILLNQEGRTQAATPISSRKYPFSYRQRISAPKRLGKG
jgi:hypothetical protein